MSFWYMNRKLGKTHTHIYKIQRIAYTHNMFATIFFREENMFVTLFKKMLFFYV